MNTSLAFTLSPPHRFTSGTDLKNPNRVLYEEDKNQIKSILKYIRCGTYILYPEFDDKARLHYHGIINLDSNQKVRFYKYAHCKLKQIGFVDFKPLKTFEDKLKWVIYMSKHWPETKQVLEITRPIMVSRPLIKALVTDKVFIQTGGARL